MQIIKFVSNTLFAILLSVSNHNGNFAVIGLLQLATKVEKECKIEQTIGLNNTQLSKKKD